MKTPIFPFVLLTLTVLACRPYGHVDATYVSADAADRWNQQLQASGTNLHPYVNTVVLVSPPSECGACVAEMTEWERMRSAIDLHLVWMPPVEDLRDALVWRNRHGWNLEPYPWVGLPPVEADLLPFLPAKVLLAPDGRILRIHRLGGDPDFEAFLDDARAQRISAGG